jgi:hypothetical protein
VLVGQEPRLHALDVADTEIGGALPQSLQHRRGDVHGNDPANLVCGRKGERSGPRSDVDECRAADEPVLAHQDDVVGWIESLLRVVPRDELGIQMLGPRVGKLIDHPGRRHPHIVARARPRRAC